MPTLRNGRTAPAVATAILVAATCSWTGQASAQSTAGPLVIYSVAGTGRPGFSGDGGPATKSLLRRPTGVAEDQTGNIYFSDTGNNRVRKVLSSSGLIQTVAGDGQDAFAGDGGPASNASLSHPTGLAVDTFGDLFIADTGNNRIREVKPSGIISTYAGAPREDSCRKEGQHDAGDTAETPTWVDGVRPLDGSLCGPTGIALDGRGNLFISDTGHNRVREASSSGVMTTFAGTGSAGFGGDAGRASGAELRAPTGLAVDALHDVFIADTFNNRVRVVNASGMIFTFAGNGTRGGGGDGGSAPGASLAEPTGLAIDPIGNVYVSDTGNNRIRLVNASNTISTYVGTGVPGYSGDGGVPTAARINRPTGVVASDGTRVFFADTSNQRIRGVTSGPLPVIPETNSVVLLPVSALLFGAMCLIVIRRRRRGDASG